MEHGSFWKFEDMQKRGVLSATGAGTLGHGIMGNCGLSHKHAAHEREAAPPGLFKTLSMPMLATHSPCGQRVGEDLGMSECGTPRRREREHRPLGGGLEDRLSHLERSFTGTPGPQALGFRPSSNAGSISTSRLASRGGVYTSCTNRSGVSRGNLSTAYSMRSELLTPNSAIDGRFRDSSTVALSTRASSRAGTGSGARPTS